MKAVICKQAQLDVVDHPALQPAKGQLLLEVVRCGICGSDLHARHHCDEAAEVVTEAALTIPIPNGLAPDIAALTEPMAVGLHAVRRGEVKKGDVAIVIGCGPVGLSVIAMLKADGVRQVIASDFSPGRRALAQR